MLRMKNSLFSTFIFLSLSLLFAIPCTSVKAANELEKNIEEIANQNYFRLSSIELLYDKYRDYEKAFECKTIMENVKVREQKSSSNEEEGPPQCTQQ